MPEKAYMGLRKFNRAIFNPVIKLFAGRFFYSLVIHTGRRSGKTFSTPVLAAKTGGLIYIPLPYGANTDWSLNIQASGNCRVQIAGRCYPSTCPEIVGPSAALLAFSPFLQRTFRRAGVNHYLRLKIQG